MTAAGRDSTLGLPSPWPPVPKEQGDPTAKLAGGEDEQGGYRPSALLAAGVVWLETLLFNPSRLCSGTPALACHRRVAWAEPETPGIPRSYQPQGLLDGVSRRCECGAGMQLHVRPTDGGCVHVRTYATGACSVCAYACREGTTCKRMAGRCCTRCKVYVRCYRLCVGVQGSRSRP